MNSKNRFEWRIGLEFQVNQFEEETKEKNL